MEYVSWASDIKEVNGPRKEHVSFPSFVKRFGLTNKAQAISRYEWLLNFPRLKTGRRQRLRAAYDAWLPRMAEFWSSWDEEQADRELNVSCRTVTMRTAIMAQRASLAVSAKGFSAIHTDVTTTPTTGTDDAQYFENEFPHEDPEDDDSEGDGECESVKNKSASLPSSAPRGLSTNHEELYNAALRKLKESGPVEAKKDVLVLLSGIINTLSPDARRFRLSKKIMMESPLPALDPESQIHTAVKDVLAALLKALYPSLDKDQYSEPDFVKLQEKIGELASKASAGARQAAAQAYGSTTSTLCGRKIDMSIRIQVRSEWKQDIVIFEFKSSQATKQMLQRQQKKSVRLNAAIMIDLEARGLNIERSYPIVAEGRGLSLDFYTLRRYEDVLGAGRATVKGISLPSQETELRAFLLGDTILTLMTFREHLRRYAIDVLDALSTTPSTLFEGDDCHEFPFPPADPPARSSTPPPKKRSNTFIIFSPSKKDKHGDNDHDDVGD
ncbi:hypothetical protein EC991_009783 [Linnemannia zychae]|nr:hypothetical protein EC991_009783 [Linnemannia zychae]